MPRAVTNRDHLGRKRSLPSLRELRAKRERQRLEWDAITANVAADPRIVAMNKATADLKRAMTGIPRGGSAEGRARLIEAAAAWYDAMSNVGELTKR